MDSGKYKSAAFLIAKGAKTRVFRSLEEIPEGDRAELLRSIRGKNSGVVLIADRESRETLEKELRRRLESPPGRGGGERLRARVAVEIALAAAAALLAWALATLR